jgi:hypothetical protein
MRLTYAVRINARSSTGMVKRLALVPEQVEIMDKFLPGTKIFIRAHVHIYRLTLETMMLDFRGKPYYECLYNGERSLSTIYVSTLETLEVVIECSPINLEQNS